MSHHVENIRFAAESLFLPQLEIDSSRCELSVASQFLALHLLRFEDSPSLTHNQPDTKAASQWLERSHSILLGGLHALTSVLLAFYIAGWVLPPL